MEFTDRERQILAELERQLTDDQPASAPPAVSAMDQPSASADPPPHSPSRPATRAAGVSGLGLITVGLLLGVGSSVLLGLILPCYWSWPQLCRSLSKPGSSFPDAIADGRGETPHDGGDQ